MERVAVRAANVDEDALPDPRPETVEDRWILSRLQRAKQLISDCITEFDFSHAALGLYDFVYGELCDWYLERVKPRLRPEVEDRYDASATLLHVLTETVQVAHPLIPFVTEEIWSFLPGAEGLLAGREAVGFEPAWVDEDAEEQVGRAIEAVQELRGWRERVEVAPGAFLPARVVAEGYEDVIEFIAERARLELPPDGGDPVATVAIPGGSVEVLAGGAFDPAAAERRKAEKTAQIESEIARSEGKLSNEGFVAKAPPDVVQAERDKLERLRAELEAL